MVTKAELGAKPLIVELNPVDDTALEKSWKRNPLETIYLSHDKRHRITDKVFEDRNARRVTLEVLLANTWHTVVELYDEREPNSADVKTQHIEIGVISRTGIYELKLVREEGFVSPLGNRFLCNGSEMDKLRDLGVYADMELPAVIDVRRTVEGFYKTVTAGYADAPELIEK